MTVTLFPDSTRDSLDWGSGIGYWTELFAAEVGDDGLVYTNARAGERFDSKQETLEAQYEPFGNIELMPLQIGASIPLEDHSVDAIMLSYIYHHLHYVQDMDESFQESSAALLKEFRRVLKPGGTFITCGARLAWAAARPVSCTSTPRPNDCAAGACAAGDTS